MEKPEIPAGSIVVGVDGSAHGERAVAWAAEQAALEQRALVLVHALGVAPLPAMAWMEPAGLDHGRLLEEARAAGRELLATAAATVEAAHPGLDVHRALRQLDPREALLDLAGDASLVVVGSRGRGPVASLLLGSVSLAVSRHADCPVVVVRPHEPAAGSAGGILVGTDGTERSGPAVEFGFRVAAARGVPLTVMHCFWDAAKVAERAWHVADDEEGCEEERALLESAVRDLRDEHPGVELRLRLARGFADQRLLEASRDAALVVVGTHPRKLLERIVYGSLTPAVVEHAESSVAVVPYRG